jgi:thiol-disulfide isomerase/thioredoxin
LSGEGKMRKVLVGLVMMAVIATVAAAESPPAQPAPLETAKQLLAQNQELGEFLTGRLASPEAAAKAEKSMAEGTVAARAAIVAQPKSAEAHHVLGMFLSLAYRPGEPAGKGETRSMLVRGSRNRAEMTEGMAELRTAARLQPQQVTYQLDYARALLVGGQAKLAKVELDGIAKRFPNLGKRERADLTELTAQAAVSAPEAGQAAARPKAITWRSYEEGVAQAQKEGKRTLVDFMADWCGYCRKMDADTYSNASVIALSGRYVFARVNVDQQGDVARKYGVTGLPTALVLDSGGREIARVIGYVPPQEFLKQVQ